MNGGNWILLFLLLTPIIVEAWKASREAREIREGREDRGDMRELPERRDLRRVHFHNKRHMLPENESKQRRSTTQKTRDVRKKVKPSGHLTPLEEDDMDNDEVVSVAIGPPPIRPKYEKAHWKHPSIKSSSQNITNTTATNIVKDVLIQLGRELLTKDVSDDFIFGQYVGNSMKNLTADLKLKMQHEMLEIIVKYQKWNRGEVPRMPEGKPLQANPLVVPMTTKEVKLLDKKFDLKTNETEDTWPDFSNLAKIVG